MHLYIRKLLRATDVIYETKALRNYIMTRSELEINT